MSLKLRLFSPLAEGILLVALFLIAFAIRGNDLAALVAFPDELTYASRAVHIVANNGAWLPSEMWDQPPLFSYILAVIIGTVGGSLDSLRYVSVVAGSASVVLAYFLGKSMYGRKAGAIAASALAVDGFHVLYSRLVYIEALASMLIIAATLLFYEGVVKRRNLKLAAAGGVVFGLALSTKYIALVMAVALLLFLLVYRRNLEGRFPRKEVFAFFGVSAAVFSPIIADLAANNVDPFYYDLVSRFQLGRVSNVLGQVRSGQVFIAGFTRFVQVFFHVSSTNPFGVFPALVVDAPLWTALVGIVLIFFVFSFLRRRNAADGLLLILFVAFLAFAFTYPARRNYFALYPSLIAFIMLGRVGQTAIENLRGRGRGGSATRQLLALSVVSLTVTGIAINTLSVSVMYTNGFGDWDEIYPIMNYISHNAGNNTYVATDLAEIGFYVGTFGINASIAWMKQPSALYSQTVGNQTLLTPVSGQYPIFWVISPAVLDKVQPKFVVIPAADYAGTTGAFHQFIQQRYYQPLNTKLVLIFELRPGSPKVPG